MKADFNREGMLAALQGAKEFDFVIVGGGATGLGAAVDAASRGHSVALVEAHDFAKGTSSRSTKLVHGGVRYLKQGNISLVVEALKERGLLATNAPHLVSDMRFVIPSDEDVLGVFAGLRPLVTSGDGADTAAMSRDHTILIFGSGLITVTGGKWTTYRKMGEDVIDQAEMATALAGELGRDTAWAETQAAAFKELAAGYQW